MPIKFGDLIENANAEYAVIDLTDNQSRGVAFVDDFSGVSGGVSSAINNAVSIDKRRQGMLLVNKDSAEVFLLEGAPNNAAAGYTNAEFGLIPGEPGSKWKAVGSLELQNTNIDVNISSDKSFGKYTPSFNTTVGGTSYQGVIPVEAWMALAAAGNPSPVASSQGATSLEIIRDALNETFPLNPLISTPATIEFNQPTGTITLAISCPNPNATTMESFQVFFKEIGGSSFTLLPGGTITTAIVGGSTPGTATFTASIDHVFDVGANQFDSFDGFEYKVVATDGAGATGEGTTSVARGSYNVPTVSNFNVTRQYNNNLYNGVSSASVNDRDETDDFRVLGNIDSDITFTITPSTLNHSSITSASHTYKLLRKSTGGGASDSWVEIETGSFTLGGNSSHTVTTTDAGSNSLSVKTEKLQYCVLVFDAYTQSLGYSNSQLINANSSNNSAWGQKSFNINGSTLGNISAYGAASTGFPNNAGQFTSKQIRFAAPQFVGYIPESEIGTGGSPLPPNALTTSRMNDIIDFQFGTTDFTDVRNNNSSPGIGNVNSPYLLTRDFPKTGNTQGNVGSYSLGALTAPGGARVYMILTKQDEGADTFAPGQYDSGKPSSDYDDSSASARNPGIGSGEENGEIYVGTEVTNQNNGFQRAAAPAGSIKIIGRLDNNGNPVTAREVTVQYYILLAAQTGSVSNTLKVSTT